MQQDGVGISTRAHMMAQVHIDRLMHNVCPAVSADEMRNEAEISINWNNILAFNRKYLTNTQ